MESVQKYHPDAALYILIVDKTSDEKVRDEVINRNKFAALTWLEELDIPELPDMIKRYDIVELNTAVKPFFLDRLLHKMKYQKVVYLDSDILLFHSMDEVLALLEEHNVILTPHLISTTEDEDTAISVIDDFLQYGIYNLGFIALRNSSTSRDLLTWWMDKLKTKYYLSPERHLAWDQKWMDFAPAMFDRVYILRNPGYNMAFWNLQKRILSKKDDSYLVNGRYPLVFYHFSHYRMEYKELIADVQPESRRIAVSTGPDLEEIFESYYNNVQKNHYAFFSRIEAGFRGYYYK